MPRHLQCNCRCNLLILNPKVADERKSELTVVTRAKDLCSYVMTITQKSPKQFRFTFVSRMHNLTIDIMENIFRANDIFITKGDMAAHRQRLECQRRALTDFRILAYVSQLAIEQKCILLKQSDSFIISDKESN